MKSAVNCKSFMVKRAKNIPPNTVTDAAKTIFLSMYKFREIILKYNTTTFHLQTSKCTEILFESTVVH